MKIYYMRDNHTFCRLPERIGEAETILRCEFDGGHTWGTVFDADNVNNCVHARGDIEEFLPRVRAWYVENVQ